MTASWRIYCHCFSAIDLKAGQRQSHKCRHSTAYAKALDEVAHYDGRSPKHDALLCKTVGC